MSEPDPYEKVTGLLADATERLVEYAGVWRAAIERNARGEYAADDLLVDMQALWGMSIRDATRVGAALLEAAAPLVRTDTFTSEGGSEGDGEPTED